MFEPTKCRYIELHLELKTPPFEVTHDQQTIVLCEVQFCVLTKSQTTENLRRSNQRHDTLTACGNKLTILEVQRLYFDLHSDRKAIAPRIFSRFAGLSVSRSFTSGFTASDSAKLAGKKPTDQSRTASEVRIVSATDRFSGWQAIVQYFFFNHRVFAVAFLQHAGQTSLILNHFY